MNPLRGINEIKNSYATIINALRAIKIFSLYLKESGL